MNDSIPLSSAQLDSLLVDRLEPALRAGDYAGGVVALAEGMWAELAGTPSTAAPASAGATAAPPTAPPADGGSGGGSKGFSIASRSSRSSSSSESSRGSGSCSPASGRPRSRRSAPPSRRTRTRHSSSADDMIRDMEQDVGFAQAEFGDEAAAPFAAAVVAGEGRDGRGVQGPPEARRRDPGGRRDPREDDTGDHRAVHAREGRSSTPSGRASRTSASSRRRRPRSSTASPAQETQLEARIAAAATLDERLGATYADVGPSSRSPATSRRRGSGSTSSRSRRTRERRRSPGATRGRGHSSRSPRRSRSSRPATSSAPSSGPRRPRTTRTRRSPVSSPRRRPTSRTRRRASDRWAAHAARAEVGEVAAQVAAARAAIAQPRPDSLAAYGQAVAAAQAADEILAGIRSESERIAREKATFQQTIGAAELEYRRAADFIAARRSGVDREARTRLSEAERHLAAAQVLATQDVARAAEEARLADSLAEQAMQLASADFDHYDRGGPGAPPSRGGGGGVDVAGILIGRRDRRDAVRGWRWTRRRFRRDAVGWRRGRWRGRAVERRARARRPLVSGGRW